jgi:hypothetical protein
MDGIEAREALAPGITRVQLAWDFEELDRSDLSEFVNRWLGWFGLAAQGQLQRPGDAARENYACQQVVAEVAPT